MAHATRGGASIEPNEAPMLKMPPASPRSLAGNHSAVAFIPARFAETLPTQSSILTRSPRQAAAIREFDAVLKKW
jgi:hypothetical protein